MLARLNRISLTRKLFVTSMTLGVASVTYKNRAEYLKNKMFVPMAASFIVPSRLAYCEEQQAKRAYLGLSVRSMMD